jgi:hypothetical protein
MLDEIRLLINFVFYINEVLSSNLALIEEQTKPKIIYLFFISKYVNMCWSTQNMQYNNVELHIVPLWSSCEVQWEKHIPFCL